MDKKRIGHERYYRVHLRSYLELRSAATPPPGLSRAGYYEEGPKPSQTSFVQLYEPWWSGIATTPSLCLCYVSTHGLFRWPRASKISAFQYKGRKSSQEDGGQLTRSYTTPTITSTRPSKIEALDARVSASNSCASLIIALRS